MTSGRRVIGLRSTGFALGGAGGGGGGGGGGGFAHLTSTSCFAGSGGRFGRGTAKARDAAWAATATTKPEPHRLWRNWAGLITESNIQTSLTGVFERAT